MLLLLKNVTSPQKTLKNWGLKTAIYTEPPAKTRRPSLTARRTLALPYVFRNLWLPEMSALTVLKSRPPYGVTIRGTMHAFMPACRRRDPQSTSQDVEPLGMSQAIAVPRLSPYLRSEELKSYRHL